MEVEVARVPRFQRTLKRQRSVGRSRSVGPKRRKLASVSGFRNPYGLNQGNHGAELKSVEVGAGAQECSTTAVITLINGVATGDDINNRDGRKFTMKSILVRGTINVGATPTGAAYRWMIVYDKQANGAAPVIGDILNVSSMLGCNNLSNRDRFIIIADKTGFLEATGTIVRTIKKFINCNLETVCSGTTNGIASIATGSLFLVTLGNLATGVTAPNLNVLTRVRFVEK